jgi:hypothetical protein
MSSHTRAGRDRRRRFPHNSPIMHRVPKSQGEIRMADEIDKGRERAKGGRGKKGGVRERHGRLAFPKPRPAAVSKKAKCAIIPIVAHFPRSQRQRRALTPLRTPLPPRPMASQNSPCVMLSLISRPAADAAAAFPNGARCAMDAGEGAVEEAIFP